MKRYYTWNEELIGRQTTGTHHCYLNGKHVATIYPDDGHSTAHHSLIVVNGQDDFHANDSIGHIKQYVEAETDAAIDHMLSEIARLEL